MLLLVSHLLSCQFHYTWNGRTHTQWLRQWTRWSEDTVKCYSRLMSVLQWKLWINKQVSFKCHSTFYLQICCSFTKNKGTHSQVGQWGTFFMLNPGRGLSWLTHSNDHLWVLGPRSQYNLSFLKNYRVKHVFDVICHNHWLYENVWWKCIWKFNKI